jgi:hypothetical protein
MATRGESKFNEYLSNHFLRGMPSPEQQHRPAGTTTKSHCHLLQLQNFLDNYTSIVIGKSGTKPLIFPCLASVLPRLILLGAILATLIATTSPNTK